MNVLNNRIAAFHQLHSSGCFVMPNPWDAGSARALEQLGFPALATTSAGLAWTLGRADNHVSLEEGLEHLRTIAAAVAIPVNADFEGGYARAPEEVAVNVAMASHTGIAGLSIEDSSGDAAEPLFDFDLAVERIAAARAAIDATGTGVLLTGRSEGFVAGRPDIDETIRRLVAYAEAGADCLYAPRIDSVEQIMAVISAVAPKPVNLLINAPFITVAEAAELGVRRISVGGTLARTAWGGFLAAAKEIADSGTATCFQDLPNVDALMAQFADQTSPSLPLPRLASPTLILQGSDLFVERDDAGAAEAEVVLQRECGRPRPGARRPGRAVARPVRRTAPGRWRRAGGPWRAVRRTGW